MERAVVDSILAKMQKPASQTTRLESVRSSIPANKKKLTPEDLEDDEDDEEYIPVGIGGLMAASEKLLAVNRGIDKPDERDSLIFKRFMTTDRLLAERIDMDADRTRMKIMPAIAKQRSLKSMPPFVFDHYMEGFLLGNPLSTPLEEINPLHLIEQSRRVTQMGPGGIGSDNAVTEDMQCHDGDTEVFTKKGWKKWSAITSSDLFACRINGRLEFHQAISLTCQKYKGIMYGVKSRSVNFLVTPNHRFYTASSARTENWGWETADVHYSKNRVYMATSLPYGGNDNNEYFILPSVELKKGGYNLTVPPPIHMGDWCEFLGWFMSEGSCYDGVTTNRFNVTLTQDGNVNPEKRSHMWALCSRLPFVFNGNHGNNIKTRSRVLYEYLQQFGKSYEKFLPDFIFEVKPEYRRRFLNAFLAGDGHRAVSGNCLYSTSSKRLADDIETLLQMDGQPVSRGKPWSAKNRAGKHSCMMYRVNELTVPVKEIKSSNHYTEEYDGYVYCATVPGSLLLTKRGGVSFWNGNSIHPSQFGFISTLEGPESEKAGIDTRMAWGTRIGSNGKLYQLFKDRISGKMKWMSPSDLDGKVLGLPQ